MATFLEKFARLRADCRRPDGPRRIAVVGGGAGGVELILSVRTRLRSEARQDGRDPEAFSFTLITDGDILPTHNARVRAAFRRVLGERRIELLDHRRVTAVEAVGLILDDGQRAGVRYDAAGDAGRRAGLAREHRPCAR